MSKLQTHAKHDLLQVEGASSSLAPGDLVNHIVDRRSLGTLLSRRHNLGIEECEVLWSHEPKIRQPNWRTLPPKLTESMSVRERDERLRDLVLYNGFTVDDVMQVDPTVRDVIYEHSIDSQTNIRFVRAHRTTAVEKSEYLERYFGIPRPRR